MKNLSFTLLLLAAMFNSALATDLSVSEGGGGGAYSTITDALNAAAASGDRIIIMPKAGGATYNESLTITKSVQLLSGEEGVYWRMLGNITFNPTTSGSILNIVGMNNLAGNIITSIPAPGATRTNVRILGCTLNSGFINFNFNNYELTCESDSLMSGYINLSYGKVVGSYINTYSLLNNSITIGNNDVNATNDYVYVVGNKIVTSTGNFSYNGINCITSKHYFYISNNFIQSSSNYQIVLYVSNSKTGLLENQVLNNTIKGNVLNYYWPFEFFSMNSPVVIHSNVFGSNLNYGITSNTALNTAIGFNHFATTVTQMLGGLAVNSGTNTQSTFSIDPVSGAATSGSPINGGNPDFGHYDLNLTVNDAGTGGGSFTIAQFHPIASTTGSRTAFVLAPRRVVTGQNFTINADGFDK